MKLIQNRDYSFVFYILALMIFLVFAGLSVYGDGGLLRLMQLKKFKNSLIAQNKRLLLENIAYLQELKNLKNPHFLENRARESLGFVYPDEIVYVVDDVK